MNKTDKAKVEATPFVLILLAVSYMMFKYHQDSNVMLNDMKSVLAQARVADMNTLSSSGIVAPLESLLVAGKGSDLVYFHFNSCCSQQQFAKPSCTFYKAGTILQYGRTYKDWSGPFWKAYFPEHLSQGSFGDAEVKVQGKTYVLQVVNDTKAKKTTIIMGPN